MLSIGSCNAKLTRIFLPYLQSTSNPYRLSVEMKVLVQNRIDRFTEVQLSALAAFQGKQTDGGLSKNLAGGEKRHSFTGYSLPSVLRHDAHTCTLQFNIHMLLD